MKPIERVQKIINAQNLTVSGFEKEIGASNGTIRTAIERNSNLKDETLNNILTAFPDISAEWLLTGQGEMYKSKENDLGEPENKYPSLQREMKVPLVTHRAQAGFMSGWGDTEYLESLPKVTFEVDREYKGTYLCFEVMGDSMYNEGNADSLQDRDILLGREVNRVHWRYKLHIRNWKYFVVAHKELGLVVKQIIKHDVETGKLVLHSLNPYYDDQVVYLDDVSAIFNVVDLKRSVIR